MVVLYDFIWFHMVILFFIFSQCGIYCSLLKGKNGKGKCIYIARFL